MSGRMSTKTGVAPRSTKALAVETNVKDGMITSSPGPTSASSAAISSAAVQECVRRRAKRRACLPGALTAPAGKSTVARQVTRGDGLLDVAQLGAYRVGAIEWNAERHRGLVADVYPFVRLVHVPPFREGGVPATTGQLIPLRTLPTTAPIVDARVKSLSVVIPVYNSRDSLPDLCRRLTASFPVWRRPAK